MSQTELLMKEIEGLSPHYMAQVFGFINQLKHKAPPDQNDEPAVPLLSLRGSCKGEDTLDAYFERKRADKALEDEIDKRRLTGQEP